MRASAACAPSSARRRGVSFPRGLGHLGPRLQQRPAVGRGPGLPLERPQRPASSLHFVGQGGIVQGHEARSTLSVLGAYLIAFWPEIQAQWGGIIDWFSTFFDSPLEHFKQVFAWIRENWAALILGLPGVILAVFTPSVFRPIQDAFDSVVKWIGDQWDALWSRITGGVSAIGKRIAGFFSRAAAEEPSAYGTKTGPNLIPVAPRADGGPIEPGQGYLVGEEGPELVSPRSRGFVLPAALTGFIRSFESLSLPSAPLGKGGRGGTVINSSPQINVQADIRVPEGTTAEQGRLLTEQIGRVFDTKIRDAIRTASYEFVDMEAPA